MKILLASGSPRRRELIHMIFPDAEIAPSREVDELYDPLTPPAEVPVVLSQLKSEAYADMAVGDVVVVTADTVVIVDGRILGKPADEAEACSMLSLLSGRSHRVVTGVTLRTEHRTLSFASETLVHFDTLTPEEIKGYVEHYRPLDKAGAYGVQEYIGGIGISGIDGCFYNVMGLPLHDLYRAVKSLS